MSGAASFVEVNKCLPVPPISYTSVFEILSISFRFYESKLRESQMGSRILGRYSYAFFQPLPSFSIIVVAKIYLCKFVFDLAAVLRQIPLGVSGSFKQYIDGLGIVGGAINTKSPRCRVI